MGLSWIGRSVLLYGYSWNARSVGQGQVHSASAVDRLREILEKHPRGISLYDLADALSVTVRSMRRYLKEIEREYDLRACPRAAAVRCCGRCAPVKCRARSNCAARKPTHCSRRAGSSNRCAAPPCSRRSTWPSASCWPSRSVQVEVRTRDSRMRGSRIASFTCRTHPKITRRRPKSWTISSRRCPTFVPCACRTKARSRRTKSGSRSTLMRWSCIATPCIASAFTWARRGAHLRARSHAGHRVRNHRALRFAG